MSKMWAGRTAGDTDRVADDFNSSIRFDQRMYRQDITGSMAHAAMLGKQGIITEDEAGQIIDGLQGILDDLSAGRLEIDPGAEDIHMFVEQVLTQRLGALGKKLHTARWTCGCTSGTRLTPFPPPCGSCWRYWRTGRRNTGRISCPATPICSGPSP